MAAQRPASDRGFVTTEMVIAVGFSMVFLVMMVSLLLFGYARGVIRGALDDGVHAGSRAFASNEGAESACRARIDEAMAALLNGPIVGGTSRDCRVEQGPGGQLVIRAVMQGTFKLPMIPRFAFGYTATAVKEERPR